MCVSVTVRPMTAEHMWEEESDTRQKAGFSFTSLLCSFYSLVYFRSALTCLVLVWVRSLVVSVCIKYGFLERREETLDPVIDVLDIKKQFGKLSRLVLGAGFFI